MSPTWTARPHFRATSTRSGCRSNPTGSYPWRCHSSSSRPSLQPTQQTASPVSCRKPIWGWIRTATNSRMELMTPDPYSVQRLQDDPSFGALWYRIDGLPLSSRSTASAKTSGWLRARAVMSLVTSRMGVMRCLPTLRQSPTETRQAAGVRHLEGIPPTALQPSRGGGSRARGGPTNTPRAWSYHLLYAHQHRDVEPRYLDDFGELGLITQPAILVSGENRNAGLLPCGAKPSSGGLKHSYHGWSGA